MEREILFVFQEKVKISVVQSTKGKILRNFVFFPFTPMHHKELQFLEVHGLIVMYCRLMSMMQISMDMIPDRNTNTITVNMIEAMRIPSI
jgi:hypothetical protein